VIETEFLDSIRAESLYETVPCRIWMWEYHVNCWVLVGFGGGGWVANSEWARGSVVI